MLHSIQKTQFCLDLWLLGDFPSVGLAKIFKEANQVYTACQLQVTKNNELVDSVLEHLVVKTA